EMSARLLDRGEALVPIIQTFRDIALFSFNIGRHRLAPIFAERAANLAESGGLPLKPLWVAAEAEAAWYHSTEGHSAEALRRIDRALRQARTFLDTTALIILNARYRRAAILNHLGRYDDVIAEIEAFAPIQAEVRGARNPDVLTTRHLRASVLDDLGRYDDAI